MIIAPCFDQGGYRRFGFNLDGLLHCGKDFRSPAGTNVMGSEGEIVFSGYVNGYGGDKLQGGVIWIKHTMENGMEYLIQYGHVFSELIRGDLVEQGQVIGKIHSYFVSHQDLPHVHFCIYTGNAIPTGKWGYVNILTGWLDPDKFLPSAENI